MKEYVYFLTPEELAEIGRMRLRHDDGEVMEATRRVVVGQLALVAVIPDSISDGHGCWRDLEADSYGSRSEHGVLRLTSINPVTGSVAFESDTGTLDKLSSRPFVRSGLVRAVGREFVDDDGAFFPLGATLFWVTRGWKFEPNRVRQNLEWLAKHQWDYIRILCCVGWRDNEADPLWPDYQDVLAGLIDAAYDDYGLRVEPTVWGGFNGRDPLFATDQVLPVLRERKEKILHTEAVNEYFNNLPDIGIVREMARRLMTTGILTASSCPHEASDAAVNELTSGVCNTVTVHLDRSYGDNDWRFVRQPWDVKNFSWTTSQNEPKGPASSVSPNNNPLQLASCRGVGILCGASAYVLHNGAGIYGVRHVHPGTGSLRTANLWEMPDIEPVMEAVRGIDDLIPPGVPNWSQANTGWVPPNPVHPFDISNTFDKAYAAVLDKDFVFMPCGVAESGIVMTAKRHCVIEAYHPVTHDAVVVREVSAGGRVTLPGAPNQMASFVVSGSYL